MDMANFEEAVLAAAEHPTRSALDALLQQLSTAGNPVPAELLEKMDTLWEAWEEKGSLNPDQAKFCMSAAALPGVSGSAFRKLLPAAAKAQLPPYLGHNPVMKALGVRDEKVSPAEVAARFARLQQLKNGYILFMPGSGRWGVIGTIDEINAVLPVSAFGSVGGAGSYPLEQVLKEALILRPIPELVRLTDIGTVPTPAANFRMIVGRCAVLPISDAQMKLMAQSGCARKLDAAAFEKYWGTAAPVSAAAAPRLAPNGQRRSCDGRSLTEIAVLLEKENKQGAGKLAEDEIAAFRVFFEKLKPETARRDAKLLATIIAELALRADDNAMHSMLQVLAGKTPFWPEKPGEAKMIDFSVWGELSSKVLESLSQAVAMTFDEEYLAACAMRLPLKALNCLGSRISAEALCTAVRKYRNCGADLLMWIWKNRKKHANKELLALVNLDLVMRILGSEEPPKAWGAARREMRAMLLDDWNFQSHLIDMLDGNTIMFGSVLQGALFLSSGERQSLMVKLARQSAELREYLESGAGQRILNAGIGKSAEAAPAGFEPSYASVKSHKALMKELDDIINIYVPENREALATARAHGDFRENSEFDAAKERRNHLSRRRSEIERELQVIQPVLMKDVVVKDTAVIGSQVDLEYSDGAKETHCLLGAWDGDPERGFLSYRTVLGKALLNRRVGESFTAPGNRKCTLKAVRTLPAELIAELDA